MTSENSFWDSVKMNFRRRVWVCVLAFAALLTAFPGALTISFTQISTYNSYGAYQTAAEYRKALTDAAVTSFSNNYIAAVITVLAVLIAVQGYSYLFSRKKVDMYYSVPVSLKKRFFTIYFNGIFIFLVSLLAGFAVSVIMLLFKSAFTSELAVTILTELLMDILLFVAEYNIAVFASMMTGNLFISGFLSVLFMFYTDIWSTICNEFRQNFYVTLLTAYDESLGGISPLSMWLHEMYLIDCRLSVSGDALTNLGRITLIYLVWIAIFLIWAFSCYKKRPAEAAGVPMAFYSSRVIIKMMTAIPFALLFGSWIYGIGESNRTLTVISMIICTILLSLLTEIAFNFDFRSAFKHWGIITVSLAAVIGFYLVYSMDLTGFDRYVPESDRIVSYAVVNENECYYTESINFDAASDDYAELYTDPYIYAKDNMELKDTDAITALASKSIAMTEDEREDALPLDVYYRLDSGAEKSRRIWVDINDNSNDEYLNRIIGPAYYKNGIWQAMTTDIPDGKVISVSYSSSIDMEDLNIEDARKIVELWRKDMENYDYNLVRYNLEEGYISVVFDGYVSWQLPVYDCFDSIKGYLEKSDRVLNDDVPFDAISSVNISWYQKDENGNYIGDLIEKEYDDETSIRHIMEACAPNPAHSGWLPQDIFNYDYSMTIMLKPEYIKEYNSYTFYSYYFLSDMMSDLRDAEIIQ